MTTLRPTLHRPRFRPLTFAAASVAIVAITYLAVALDPQRGPTTPAAPLGVNGNVVSQPVAPLVSGSEALLAALDHEIGLWASSLEANEGDYIAATRLGALHLQRARITGDLGDYERALDASERAVKADPIFWSGHTLRATVLCCASRLRRRPRGGADDLRRGSHPARCARGRRRREPRAGRRPRSGRCLRRARRRRSLRAGLEPAGAPCIPARRPAGSPRCREPLRRGGRAGRGSGRCRLLSLSAGRAPSVARQSAGRGGGVRGLARRARRIRAGPGRPRPRSRGPGPAGTGDRASRVRRDGQAPARDPRRPGRPLWLDR